MRCAGEHSAPLQLEDLIVHPQFQWSNQRNLHAALGVGGEVRSECEPRVSWKTPPPIEK